MCLRKTVRLSVCPMDRESLDALNALQVHKAAEWHTRCASREAEHLGPLLSVERLQRSPPPHNHRVRARVAVVLGRSSPLIYVDIWSARDQELELLFVKLKTDVSITQSILERDTYDRDQVLRDDLVEPAKQSLDLLLDRRVETVLS